MTVIRSEAMLRDEETIMIIINKLRIQVIIVMLYSTFNREEQWVVV